MYRLFFATSLCFLFIASITAQSTDAIGKAKGELTTCASTLDVLLVSIQQLKTKAEAEFKVEQSAIEKVKASLETRRVAIEKDNENEENMMYEKWPARIQERQKLMEEEQAILRREQKLRTRKSEYAVQMAQYEKGIIDLAKEVELRVATMIESAKKENRTIQDAKF